MPDHNPDDLSFELLAAAEPEPRRASPSLKSRIYSALQLRQSESGPLLSLTESKAAGRPLCVFENLVEIAPVGEALKSRNPCRVCHARLVAERWDNAAIFWPNCPYVMFQGRKS
jgi:hypothetical protein